MLKSERWNFRVVRVLGTRGSSALHQRLRVGARQESEAKMIRDFQLSVGDICGDQTGLRVQVEDVDLYNRVHFFVIENSEDSEAESGEMSYGAFVHRFIRIGYSCNDRRAA
jgi:hypothetical protein